MSFVLEKTAALSGPTGRLVDPWEKEFLLLADRSPVWVSYIDAQERFQYVNVTCAAWLARTTSEIVNTTVEEVSPESYEVLEPLIARALAGEEVTFEGEVGFPDGIRRRINLLFLPESDALGEVEGYHAFVVDVGGQREAKPPTDETGDEPRLEVAAFPAFGSLQAPILGYVDISAAALPRAGLLHETPAKVLEAVYGETTPTAQSVVCRQQVNGGQKPAARTLNDEIRSGEFLSVQPLQVHRGEDAALRVTRNSLAAIAVEGPVTQANPTPGTITLLGVAIALSDTTEIRDGTGAPIDQKALLSRLRPGHTVRVTLAQPRGIAEPGLGFALEN